MGRWARKTEAMERVNLKKVEQRLEKYKASKKKEEDLPPKVNKPKPIFKVKKIPLEPDNPDDIRNQH